MLIVCSGPDTFRALKKARELEVAFKQKYDAQGLSVEHISSGKSAITEIAARAGAVSLFASRRFVRTSNVLAEATKVQRGTLKKVLMGDQDGFIVLSVEEEPPIATVLKELEPEVKIVRYDFAASQGEAFFAWAREEAAEMGFVDEKIVREIARATEGDSWSCYFELMKRAAYPEAETSLMDSAEGTIFSFADAYVAGRPEWWGLAGQADFIKQTATTFLMQTRSALRVRDGAVEGLHSFVVRKMRGQRFEDVDEAFARVVESFFVQRSGYGDDKEALALL